MHYYYRKRSYGTAMRFLEKACVLDPDSWSNEVHLYYLGQCYWRLGDNQRAVELLRNSLEFWEALGPGRPGALTDRDLAQLRLALLDARSKLALAGAGESET